MYNINTSLFICMALQIRENWLREVEPLPAPLRYAGFTLIELSIALVIIGLLVGGVLVGQSLINAAETRNTIKEFEMIESGVLAFRLKYNCTPGDCRNATSFFGTATGPFPSNTPKVETYNGDGNGRIGSINGGNPAGGGHNEWFTIWQHLANAGYIPGQYSGTYPVGGSYWTCDFNTSQDPHCLVSKSGNRFSIYYYDGTSTGFQGTDPGHYVGLAKLFGGGQPAGPIYTPTTMQLFDAKIDDGKPGTGKVKAQNYYSSCVLGTVADTATYNTSNSNPQCYPQYRINKGLF